MVTLLTVPQPDSADQGGKQNDGDGKNNELAPGGMER
jgi:hypothetical protein